MFILMRHKIGFHCIVAPQLIVLISRLVKKLFAKMPFLLSCNLLKTLFVFTCVFINSPVFMLNMPVCIHNYEAIVVSCKPVQLKNHRKTALFICEWIVVWLQCYTVLARCCIKWYSSGKIFILWWYTAKYNDGLHLLLMTHIQPMYEVKISVSSTSEEKGTWLSVKATMCVI